MKFATCVRLGFNHLKKHKSKHDFQVFIDPLYSEGNEIKPSILLYLHCEKLKGDQVKSYS